MNLNILIQLADEFDKRGMIKEANEVDSIIKSAVDFSRLSGWLRKQYDRLRQLFQKKKKNPIATKEYDVASTNRLDDMLRRKQSGPAEERVYLWFCQRFPNSCQSCNSRHGRMRTLKQWRTQGVPGPMVCENDTCTCRLVLLSPGGALQTNEDGDFAAGSIGIREDNIGLGMNQGFTLEPFFSNYGNLD